jgi:hypothetical protein
LNFYTALIQQLSSDTPPPQQSSNASRSGIACHRRRLLVTVAAFLAAGALFLMVNLGLPLVRNALIYGTVTLNIMDHGFNPLPVIADLKLSYGKPILFGFLATPLVWWLGVNAGVKVASFLATAFFLWMVGLVLPRMQRRAALDPGLAPLALTLVALNPLVLYQFWSAYPDTLFAGEVLLAFLLTDSIASEPERDTRWHILGLGAVIYAAIHTKLYGAVLGLACPLYLLLHARGLLERSTHRRAKLVLLAAVWSALALGLLLAKLDRNPTLDFAEGALAGGARGYLTGLTHPSARRLLDALLLIGFTGLLNFHAALVLLATRRARRAWPLASTAFAAVYTVGLLPFSGTAGNMRYLLPVFPFVAVVLAAGAGSIRPTARRAILGAYASLAVLLVLYYNLAPVQRALAPLGSRVSAVHPRVTHGLDTWLDNLRLHDHVALARTIDRINTKVPTGGVLYWSSDYYGTATYGLAKHLGIREDLEVRYVVSPVAVPPVAQTVYLWQYQYRSKDTPPRWPTWATASLVGHGLFRLTPPSQRGGRGSGGTCGPTHPGARG